MLFSRAKEIAVDAGGISTASMTQKQSFAVAINVSDVANYVRWGNDLIIELSGGKAVRINNFFINGPAFHTLILTGAGRLAVDFSMAVTNEGDGIIDSAVEYHNGGSGNSGNALLAILGGAAVAGGIAALASDSGGSSHHEEKGDYPPLEIGIKNDQNESDIIEIANGGATNDTTPLLEGENATPGATITIRLKGYDPVTVTVDEDGNWSYTFPELSDGDYEAVITETDSNGHITGESTIEWTVDTVPPESAPELGKVEDKVSPVTGELKDGDATNDASPTFSGTGEPGAVINLYDVDEATGEKTLIGSTIVDKNGNWSVKPKAALGEGEHTLRIAQGDLAGNENEGQIDFHLVIDVTAPGPLSMEGIKLIDSEGKEVKTGASTDDANLVFNGEVGGTEATWIEVVDQNGQVIATIDVDQKTGEWTWDMGGIVSRKGPYGYQFRAVDAAGNRGSLTNPYRFQYTGESRENSNDKDDGEKETPPDSSGEKPGDGDETDDKDNSENPDGGDNDTDNVIAAGGNAYDVPGDDLLSISYGQGDDGMAGYAIDSIMHPASVSSDMSDILAYGAAVSSGEIAFDDAPLHFADSNSAEDTLVNGGEFAQAAIIPEAVLGAESAQDDDSISVAQMQSHAALLPDTLHIDDLLYQGGNQAVHMVETLLAGSLLSFPQHDLADIETAIACQQVIV